MLTGEYAHRVVHFVGVKNPRYRCHTTEGDFVVELFMDSMPLTASNFVDLAETGFFDGIHFHRIIDNFMIQFGCPYARHHRHPWAGTGGPPASTTFKVGSYAVTRDEQGTFASISVTSVSRFRVYSIFVCSIVFTNTLRLPNPSIVVVQGYH